MSRVQNVPLLPGLGPHGGRWGAESGPFLALLGALEVTEPLICACGGDECHACSAFRVGEAWSLRQA